jgi:hypothetical protein
MCLLATSPEAITQVISSRTYDYEKPLGFKRSSAHIKSHGIISQEREGQNSTARHKRSCSIRATSTK